ncbi:MAG: DHA2 family efflux MFS transporter permease subunit [Legionellales bacterium]
MDNTSSCSATTQSSTIPHTPLLLFGLALATGMEFYMFDSMNLVLPDITGGLGVSADEASWLLTLYSCSLFLGVPVSIWMARYFGYKRFLISSVLLFAISTIGCMMSPNLNVMLVWRSIQGLAGAGLTVWWRAAVYVLLPKSERSTSLMRISTGLFLSSALGLVLSGILTDQFHWRLIFVPPIIYAAGAIWVLSKYFPDTQEEYESHTSDSDIAGIILLAISLISLQILLNRGHIDDWFGSPYIRILGCISTITMIFFIFWQSSKHNAHPLLKLELLRNRHVISAALIGIFTGMILSGSLFVIPQFLRTINSSTHSATQTGQIMCIYALASAVMRPISPVIIPRLGQRKVLVLALSILITAMLLLHYDLTTTTPNNYFILPLILYGFCLALLLPAVGSGTVARIGKNELLDGVSLYMTFRQFGASLGVALLTILLERRSSFHSSRLFENLNRGNEVTRNWLHDVSNTLFSRSGTSFIEAQRMGVKQLANFGKQQVSTLSYADAFLFMALVGFAALCLIPIIPPTPPTAKK